MDKYGFLSKTQKNVIFELFRDDYLKYDRSVHTLGGDTETMQ